MNKETFDLINPDTVFAQGTVSDNIYGINMANTGKLLRWVAVKGWDDDWCIYCHFANEYSFSEVRLFGDKVCSTDNILKLVPCDPEVFARYRY